MDGRSSYGEDPLPCCTTHSMANPFSRATERDIQPPSRSDEWFALKGARKDTPNGQGQLASSGLSLPLWSLFCLSALFFGADRRSKIGRNLRLSLCDLSLPIESGLQAHDSESRPVNLTLATYSYTCPTESDRPNLRHKEGLERIAHAHVLCWCVAIKISCYHLLPKSWMAWNEVQKQDSALQVLSKYLTTMQ